MDAEEKKSCPSCSQHYSMKKDAHHQKGRIPLLLKCGHSMCELCLKNVLKFSEPIECKVCHREMQIQAGDLMLLKTNFYAVFPINIYLLGELALELIEAPQSAGSQKTECYVDLKSIIQSFEKTEGKCVECQKATTKMCRQCITILCENCFNKTHKFHIFRSHVLKPLETDVLEPAFCKQHSEKQLEYYCKDCKKPICMDCMIVGGEKSCKNHDVVSSQEVNEGIVDELNEMSPTIDETYRRLTKTAVEIGHLLKAIETGSSKSEIEKVKLNIQQHFSKLHAIVQTHEQEVMGIIDKLKLVEIKSLNQAKGTVTEAIKQSKSVLKKIDAVMSSDNRNKVNLAVILSEAKEVLNSPWYLTRDDNKKEPIKVVVNEDLCTLVNDFVHLEGDAEPGYVLRTACELDGVEVPPAPPLPVFPPEMVKDVRELHKASTLSKPPPVPEPLRHQESFVTHVPTYRSKSGSNSSLNSIGSDASYKRSSRGDGHHNPVVHPVSPFAESNYPKQLVEGSQELVYVSHIVSPHKLFVQRACLQPRVKEMLRDFRNATALPRPAASHLAEGKVYLAYNKVDKEWQRCRVLSVDRRDPEKPVCTVFCIDFGSTERVPIDKLRLLPAARLHAPPLAIQVGVWGVVPRGGAWTAEDSLLLQQIIDNKQCVIFVRQIHSVSQYEVRLECDIGALEHAVSLAHALLFHERAVPHARAQLHNPRMLNLVERPRILFSSSEHPAGASEDVFITHVISPDKFYVRKCHFQEDFDQMCDEMNDDYSLTVQAGSVYCPLVGMVVVVNIDKYGEQVSCASGEGGWRRGIVSEVPGRLRVRVLLPDSGVSLLVHWTTLRHIHPKYTTKKALATECQLSGITPLNKKWSNSSVALMESYLLKRLEMRVEETGRGRGSIGVSLYDHADPTNVVCINKLMIQSNFAITTGLFTFNKLKPIEDQVYTHKNPLEKPKPTHKKQNKITVLKKNEYPCKKVTEDDLDAKDKGPIKLEVKVLSCQSPSLVYVSLVDQQKTYKELFEDIKDYYSKKKLEGKKDWTPGEKCCTVSIESNTWRRAVVMEITDDKAKVFFSDFARVEIVPISQLRELAPKFSSIGDAAIKCHLSGVMPADGEEWPSITKEFLCELVEAYQRMFITKNGAIKDNSLPVELWVYHIIQGDALEPNKAEWRCLNHKIIEQGLGVPVKSEEPITEVEDGNNDVISFLNITGSVREWLQLDPVPAEPAPSTAAAAPAHHSRGSSPVIEEYYSPRDEHNSKLVSDWLPPEPLPSIEFTAVPTYIDNEGVIYLHDATQQDTLELVRNALDVRFRCHDPRGVSTRWRVGQPCIAKFYLDDKFYRGRVLDVNEDTTTCIIHYIDYGNEECCSFDNMNSTIVLHEIPTQAHRCSLGRIRPVNGKWDKTTLDYIHKSIVEKNCFAKICGASVNGVIPIELKFDKLWINDHLVDFEMAVYTDGTKAVVPKFMPVTPQQKIEIFVESDTSSDYIVEEDGSEEPTSVHDTSTDTFDMKTIIGKDWNVLIEEEESKVDLNGSFVTYTENELSDEFMCVVSFIDENIVELTIVHNDETKASYDDMYEQLQVVGEQAKPIDGVYEHKACIALYHEDGRWYRASILQHSKAKGLVKVKYVDFGNTEVIRLDDVKEMPEELALLPPASVTARLSSVQLHPNLDSNLVREEFEKTFLTNGPFRAKVVTNLNQGDELVVDLLNDEGELVYENLIEKRIFLKVH